MLARASHGFVPFNQIVRRHLEVSTREKKRIPVVNVLPRFVASDEADSLNFGVVAYVVYSVGRPMDNVEDTGR